MYKLQIELIGLITNDSLYILEILMKNRQHFKNSQLLLSEVFKVAFVL